MDDGLMDVKALKEEAVEATSRFFVENGFAPSEDSEEWETEYRRQFELAKKRYATKRPAAAARPASPVLADERSAALPELSGAPAQARWAEKLRAERLAEIQSKALRGWLAGAWTAAKDWVDTRELSAPVFLNRVELQYAGHRRQSEERASALKAEQQAKAAASAADQRAVQAAGVTAEGLVELIDVSPRKAAVPLKLKLAELDAGGRSLRVFETGNADRLMVIETGAAGRSEYAIERDEALVGDPKLFARAKPA
jgi:hypothetical protein